MKVEIIESQSHLPTWKRVHRGMTWEQMPGSDSSIKKLNFVLFVHGKYDPDLEPVSDEDSGLSEDALQKVKRDTEGRVLKKAGRVKYGSISGGLSPKSAALLVAKAEEDSRSNDERQSQQGQLLIRWMAAKKLPRFTRAFYECDPTAHSALIRAQGKGRGIKGPLRQVSLDRIVRTFEKLSKEGWNV